MRGRLGNRRLNWRGLRSGDRGRLGLFRHDRPGLLHFPFRAEALAARAAFTPIWPRLALAIPAFARRATFALLARLLPFALRLLFAFGRCILLGRLLWLRR